MYIVCFKDAPLPVAVATKTLSLFVGDPYKPLFASVSWRGES